LFKLYVDDLKARYHDEKKIIKEVLKEKKFEVETSTTLEEFTELLNADKRMIGVDHWNIKLTFNGLMEKAEQREKDKQRDEMKKLKKTEQAFKSMLRKYDVDENTKFASIKEKIAAEEAYTSVGDEKECERMFDDFISQMQETCLHHVKKKKEKKRKSRRSRSPSASPAEEEEDAGSEDEGEIRPSKSARREDDDVVRSERRERNEGDENAESKSSKKHKKSKKKKRPKSVSDSLFIVFE
jgi:pre-mRNA-processing factor 40